ncbi:hypothetical protein ACPROK_00720 [Glutamicibacter soli]|nr:hypothetical protein [Glutamicibacter soli]
MSDAPAIAVPNFLPQSLMLLMEFAAFAQLDSPRQPLSELGLDYPEPSPLDNGSGGSERTRVALGKNQATGKKIVAHMVT